MSVKNKQKYVTSNPPLYNVKQTENIHSHSRTQGEGAKLNEYLSNLISSILLSYCYQFTVSFFCFFIFVFIAVIVDF